MIYTTDDLCLSNLKYFVYWDKVKKKMPNLKLIVFTIANYKLEESLNESRQFKQWYEEHKDWVEIAVHGYDHQYPPEAERDNFEECIVKALKILRPFLPTQYGYRSPGFQSTIRMLSILQKFGFSYIAYEDRIRYMDGRIVKPIFNTHCTLDKYNNPIGKIWREL